MSNWSALNVHVIKTKRIECTKLELPDALSKPQSFSPRSKSTSSTTSDSPHTYSSSLSERAYRNSSERSNVADSSIVESEEAEDSISSWQTEDCEVFQSFESTSESSVKQSGCVTRCLSLPTCLNPERGVGNAVSRSDPFGENLESSQRGTAVRSGSHNQDSEGFWTGFPRHRELRRCRSVLEIEEKRSRTPHAGIMKRSVASSLIADFNNNNCSVHSLERTIPHSSARLRSKSSVDLRRDWEKNILDLTSGSVAFGAERIRGRGLRRRPRSVTLTGSVYALVSSQSKAPRDRDSDRRAKSDGKQDMPKLQTVVWDYIKRRSTKRKEKSDSRSKGSSISADSQRGSSHTEESKNTSECTGSAAYGGQHNGASGSSGSPKTIPSRFSAASGEPRKFRSNTVSWRSTSDQPVRCLARWKSTPNLKYCEVSQVPRGKPKRTNSWEEVPSRNKDRTKLPLKGFTEKPEILRLLLTTAPEQRTMEERLRTLTLSREWLIKELKSMREDDRRLARQFINLRSAIVEIRRAREKEESDVDSEGEGHKPTRVSLQKIEVVRERNAREHGFKMHSTPTRNILSYC